MLRSRHFPAALVWPGLPLLYILSPGHPFGLLTGLPLSELPLTLGVLIALSAWCGLQPSPGLARRAALAIAVALGLKLLLGGLALPYGLTATYASSSGRPPAAERSTEWRIDGATRVERGLDLTGDRFPVHFFNELRFNFYTPSQPRRDHLPFTADWRGWLLESADTERCWRLETNGAATLRLGENIVATLERPGSLETRDTCGPIKKGPNALALQYTRPEGLVPVARFSELAPSGGSLPLEMARLARAPFSPEVVERDRWLGRATWLVDALMASGCVALILGVLARRAFNPGLRTWEVANDVAGEKASREASTTRDLQPRLERPLLSLSILIVFAEAVVTHSHFVGRTAILSGGNDWLAFESYARDVLLNGLLLNGGKPLGQGETFYYQPLYIYFLAGLHALFGESLHGVLLAQYLLVAVTGVLTYFLARELFGRPAAIIAFGLFWIYRYLIFNQVAGLLLSENLVSLIIPAMLLLLTRWQQTWRRADLAGGGALLGLAVLTRSTPLLFLPPALFLVARAQVGKFGHWRPAIGASTLLLLVVVAVWSLVGLRNLVVAGRPALLPESASANLWEAHRPSARVDLSRVERDPLYRRLGLDRQTREVIEYIRQDPLGYAGSLVAMGLYALGITGPAVGSNQPQYELVVLSVLYIGGLIFVPAVRAWPIWMLHAFVLTHFFQMMIFMSHQYGFRLPLPMYAPMAVVAGRTLVAFANKLRSVAPSTRRGSFPIREALPSPRAAILAAILAALLWSGREVTRPRDVEARVFGLGGDAGPSARVIANTAEAWLVNRLYFSGQDGRSLGVAYLPGLAYREMKWLDAAHALAWPAEGKRGLLVRPPGPATQLMLECWDQSDLDAQLSIPSSAAERPLHWVPDSSQRLCASTDRRLASFGRLIDLVKVWRANSASSSEAELRVAWRVVERPSVRTQLIAERIDQDGAVLATSLNDSYPSNQWEPGEFVVTRLPEPTTEGLAPGSRLAIGFTRGSPANRLAIDDPLPLYGQLHLIIDE